MIGYADYARLGAARMAFLVRNREISPVELVEMAVEHIFESATHVSERCYPCLRSKHSRGGGRMP